MQSYSNQFNVLKNQFFFIILFFYVGTLGDTVGAVPDHHNKPNITVE